MESVEYNIRYSLVYKCSLVSDKNNLSGMYCRLAPGVLTWIQYVIKNVDGWSLYEEQPPIVVSHTSINNISLEIP